jgi:predicted nucleic acid-binding protein
MQNPNCRAVVDDLEARRCAETLRIATLGTGGILVLAKKRGLITSVSDGALALRKAGLRISDEVIALLISHAGE